MGDKTLRASGALSLAVLTSRVLGLGREAVFARLFGAGLLADAFAVAFTIPNLLRDLLAEGALSSAFVPTFTAVRERDGEAAAYRLGQRIMALSLLITGALTAAGIIFAEPLVALIADDMAGDQRKVAITVTLTRSMMPLMTILSVGAVWMGMLNAQRRFLVPAFAPALFNVVSLVVGGTLWWLELDAPGALQWWAWGTLAGGLVQALAQLPTLWSIGFRPWPRIKAVLRDPDVRRIAKLMGPAVVGVAAVQINVVFNVRFAVELGDGPRSLLQYAFRLFYLPVGMFGVALATITRTRVADDAARGNLEALRASTAEGWSATWMLTGASAVGLGMLAAPTVGLLFEGGQFTAANTAATAAVLQAYLVGLVPYSLVKITAPAFYSLDRPRIPLAASVAAVVVNVTFNALTFRELGAPGLALGTALGALVNIAILRLAFRRVVGATETSRAGLQLLRCALALGLMAAAVGAGEWGAAFVAQELGWGRTAGFALTLLLAIPMGFAVYAAALIQLGYPGAALLAALPRKIVARLRRR